MRTTNAFVIAAIAAVVVACGMMGGSEQNRAQAPAARPQSMQVGSPSAEARLLGFFNMANKGDFEGGRMAQERAQSSAVKTYARQMETDHMQMLEDSERAARSLGIVPAMGPETQPLVRDHETAMQQLQSARGKDFDGAYMAHEITMHRRVLQTAASMAPQVQNPELKKLVANARPVLEAHLKAAETLTAEQ